MTRTGRDDAAEDGNLGEVRDSWLGLQDEDLHDGSGMVHLGGHRGSAPTSLGQTKGRVR
jgi:hypothetical protein